MGGKKGGKRSKGVVERERIRKASPIILERVYALGDVDNSS